MNRRDLLRLVSLMALLVWPIRVLAQPAVIK